MLAVPERFAPIGTPATIQREANIPWSPRRAGFEVAR
jgi:hypothetical protein